MTSKSQVGRAAKKPRQWFVIVCGCLPLYATGAETVTGLLKKEVLVHGFGICSRVSQPELYWFGLIFHGTIFVLLGCLLVKLILRDDFEQKTPNQSQTATMAVTDAATQPPSQP